MNKNRAQLLAASDSVKAGLHVIGAAHSNRVAVIDTPGDGVTDSVDALVTRVPDLGLLALGADCAVVALGDPFAGVAAVVHCGWRGLVVGIIPATVTAMVAQGASSSRISAQVGPSICGDCYSVEQERARQVQLVAPTAVTAAMDDVTGKDRFGIDIAQGVVEQFAALGIAATTSNVCTFESGRHFSYRREARTGRQGVLVSLRQTLDPH